MTQAIKGVKYNLVSSSIRLPPISNAQYFEFALNSAPWAKTIISPKKENNFSGSYVIFKDYFLSIDGIRGTVEITGPKHLMGRKFKNLKNQIPKGIDLVSKTNVVSVCKFGRKN